MCSVCLEIGGGGTCPQSPFAGVAMDEETLIGMTCSWSIRKPACLLDPVAEINTYI